MSNLVQGVANKLLSRLSSNQKAGVFGIGWSALAQIASLIIKLTSNLILTRLLAPEAYGLLGTAMAVLITLEWLSDLGIQPALIRHEKGGEKEYLWTGWTMGFGRGLILSAIAIGCAWPLTMFYQEPTLLGVLIVIGTRPLFLALRSPAYPTLRRKLNYKALFFDEICLVGISTVFSIGMAFVFQSVWAIVIGMMAGAATSVIMSYILCPMRPKFMWNQQAAKDVYSLGRQVFINTIVMAIWLNLDRLLGLKLLTPTEMGVYAIAFNLATVAETLVTRICDVYFSMLAREKGKEAQARWHNSVCTKVSGLVMPVVALALIASPWAIWILYDPRYHAAGLIFTILLARLMLRAFGQIQFQFLLALAQVRIATISYVIAMCLQIAMLFPFVHHFGMTGMALSVLVSTAALTLTQTLLIYRKVGSGIQPFVSTAVWSAAGLATVVFVYGNPTQYGIQTEPKPNVTLKTGLQDGEDQPLGYQPLRNPDEKTS